MPRKHYISRQKSHRRASLSRGWGVFGALLVVALIAIFALVFRQPSGDVAPVTEPAAQATLPLEISVEEAYQLYQEGVFFLDVREQSEWDAFHIPNTILIPLGELSSRLDELPRDQQIVVVCRSGNRSQIGRDTLLQAGFTNVTSVTGGVTEWSDAGYPIEGVRP